jgi:hypothetical protein
MSDWRGPGAAIDPGRAPRDAFRELVLDPDWERDGTRVGQVAEVVETVRFGRDTGDCGWRVILRWAVGQGSSSVIWHAQLEIWTGNDPLHPVEQFTASGAGTPRLVSLVETDAETLDVQDCSGWTYSCAGLRWYLKVGAAAPSLEADLSAGLTQGGDDYDARQNRHTRAVRGIIDPVPLAVEAGTLQVNEHYEIRWDPPTPMEGLGFRWRWTDDPDNPGNPGPLVSEPIIVDAYGPGAGCGDCSEAYQWVAGEETWRSGSGGRLLYKLEWEDRGRDLERNPCPPGSTMHESQLYDLDWYRYEYIAAGTLWTPAPEDSGIRTLRKWARWRCSHPLDDPAWIEGPWEEDGPTSTVEALTHSTFRKDIYKIVGERLIETITRSGTCSVPLGSPPPVLTVPGLAYSDLCVYEAEAVVSWPVKPLCDPEAGAGAVHSTHHHRRGWRYDLISSEEGLALRTVPLAALVGVRPPLLEFIANPPIDSAQVAIDGSRILVGFCRQGAAALLESVGREDRFETVWEGTGDMIAFATDPRSGAAFKALYISDGWYGFVRRAPHLEWEPTGQIVAAAEAVQASVEYELGPIKAVTFVLPDRELRSIDGGWNWSEVI